MTAAEPTAQQLDPLGALSGRRLTVGGTIIAFAHAVAITVPEYGSIVRPGFAVASLVVLAVACGALISGASPTSSPFTSRRHGLVLATALFAYLLAVFSQWGQSGYARDNWGAVSVGIIILAFAPYRPAREILQGGLVAAAFVAFVTVAEFRYLDIDTPSLLLVCVAITPVFGMTLASAAFSRTIVAALTDWRAHVAEVSTSLDADARQGVARSVQQDRVTILNRDVVPFLTELLQRNSIGANDGERARGISDTIRQVMVSEAERTWLDELMQSHVHLVGRDSEQESPTVHDPERLAESMNVEQRAALRALIVALLYDVVLLPGSLHITIESAGETRAGTLTARLAANHSAVRSQLTQYAAVFRAVFSDVRAEPRRHELTLKFSYGRG